MQNWRKNRNFRKIENADGSFNYVITVDGERVEVSEDVYTAYAQGGYKMENMEFGVKSDRVLKDSTGKAVRDEHGNPLFLPEREVSLDKLIGEDWDFPSVEPSPEDILFSGEGSETAEFNRCIALLTDEERALVQALFYEGLTEQDYAEILGIRQQNVNKRKLRILKKIKSFWDLGC